MEIIDEFSRYQIGETIFGVDLSKEKFKNMLHLVAYDIRNPKRLRQTAKICEDYGVRVEYSVFECDLTETFFEKFWKELNKVIDPEEDCILAYRICGTCVQKIESIGVVIRPSKKTLYIL